MNHKQFHRLQLANWYRKWFRWDTLDYLRIRRFLKCHGCGETCPYKMTIHGCVQTDCNYYPMLRYTEKGILANPPV